MASDYGDESGEKMLDNFTRFCELKGERAMRERAYRLQDAFDHAKSGTKAHEVIGEGEQARVEWAKLDMKEFQAIEGYDEIKQVIEAKMRAHGVEPTWFEDKEAGKEYLLFRVVDAQEVWDGFDELSRETETAAEKAAERAKGRVAEERDKAGRDERPLEERAREAREAAAALESERNPGRGIDRGVRAQDRGAR